MTEEIKKLKEEFIRIKSMGYVKSRRGGYTGLGYTFESLLGLEENHSELPDYNGIEIKTKRSYSTAYTTLFNANFDNTKRDTLKKLRDTYGFPKVNKSKLKVLYASVLASCSTFISARFLFKLKVNREEERIYLEICDRNYNYLEKGLYWDFKTLENKLNKKLKYLALIKAWPWKKDGIDYYKYYDIDFYHLKSFDQFLKLIEEGVIRVTLKLDNYTTGNRKGEVYNHGIGFEIQEMDLVKLFDKIDVK
ncbi:MAG: MvaI/BcnI family restriction endonuclease [Ruminococcus sp.]|nr:MvaI/BcnI family restriction endonuclease [Ruminococcus sp.]